MNNRKYGLIVIITAIITVVLLSVALLSKIDFRKLTTDSGFDSSWDSGGSSWDSGGSSWDSGSSSSSSSLSDDTPPEFVAVGLIIIVIVIVYILISYKKEEKEKAHSNSNKEKLSETVRKLSDNEIELLNKYGFNEKKVRDDAYRIYIDIQVAWSKNNIEEAKDLLSNELFNTYKSQIEVMKAKNERNEMANFKFLDSTIESVKEEDNSLSVSVLLNVTCNDYLLDSKNNSIIRGSMYATNYYYYRLNFIIHGEHHYFDKCPNCSAPLPKDEVNIVCSYCGSSIIRKLNKMILTRKEMIEQKHY